MTDIEKLSWNETLLALEEQSALMDVIHDRYPGKENRVLRDKLCQPHREICVRIHYRRIELVIQRNFS